MSKRLYSGRYEVQEFIADGEMGAVYKAWDNTSFNHVVALQVIHSQLSHDAGFIERFRDATRKTAQLHAHPNIVKILEVGHDHKTEYLIMEYFPSTNLRDHMRNNGTFSTRDATHVIRQIGEALSHTHSCNLLHRDIKPANILLDNNQHVKLTDFGIAKAMSDAPLTATGQLIGTLKYMSPEQAGHSKLDGRTDLYSLGMVFYELVTGKNLWNDVPNLTIYGNLQAEHTIPPPNFPPGVPQEVQEVMKDLLRFHPADRIQDAQTLVTRLKDLEPRLSNSSLVKQEEDSDTTIVKLPIKDPQDLENDTTEVRPRALTLSSSTQEPSGRSEQSSTKQPPDDPSPTKKPLAFDPASKAKDPAKPYYWTDDSESFNKQRERVDATRPLFSNQSSSPKPGTGRSSSNVKIVAAFALMCFLGIILYWNQNVFVQSKSAQEELVIQKPERIQIQEEKEQGNIDIETAELIQQTKTETVTQPAERTQLSDGEPAVQTEVLAQQAEAAADAQAAERTRQAKILADAQAAERVQQAKAAADAQAAERVRQAKILADAQAAELAQQAKAAADAQTAKMVETQSLMKLLERLRGSVAKRDLMALKQLSSMSESRYRMLKELFSRYRTVEISIGDVIRTPAKATANFQITKLIRPNGVIVRPHPIVQNIKVTVLKNEEDWNLPMW